MKVETFTLGPLETNCYVLSLEGDSDCWLFDCPSEPESLLATLQARQARPQAVFLTHAHVDHMAGLDAFRRTFPGVPVYQHRDEALWLSDPAANLSSLMGAVVTAAPAEGFLEDNQKITIGPWNVEVLHLPGHSPGSVGYWIPSESELISGDVLFRSGVGRWDFPGCSRDELQRSLKRLCGLPGETRVRPGHGGTTTIGREKTSNPYLRSGEAWD